MSKSLKVFQSVANKPRPLPSISWILPTWSRWIFIVKQSATKPPTSIFNILKAIIETIIHLCMHTCAQFILTFSPATILRPTLLFPFFYNLWNSKFQHLLYDCFENNASQTTVSTFFVSAKCPVLRSFWSLPYFNLTCIKQDNLELARSCCFELSSFLIFFDKLNKWLIFQMLKTFS